jgi:hypothetical protein
VLQELLSVLSGVLQELLSVLSGVLQSCLPRQSRCEHLLENQLRDYVAVVTQMTDKPVLSLLQQQMV